MIVYFIILVMTLMGSVASLFLKNASKSNSLLEIFKNVNLYVGGGLYFISALLNIYVLRYLDYSVVLPLTSITYIWTMIFSYHILREKITSKKIIGVSCIVCGSIIISV